MSASARPVAAPDVPERYEVKRHIATGGMASVWCAEDRVLGRTVAIKLLSERFAQDADAVRRFQREARTAARVSGHPHVVTIFDVGQTAPVQDGDAPQAFIVMEHLAGGTVADAIRVGALRRHEAMRWLREASSALDHAHGLGIVHRDIKPANFLLDSQRVLHVADFGIARVLSEETITSSGELFGTASYLAPEQALGLEATPASDRYSLAIAAFELLTGERPFSATHFAAQARQHVEDDPPAASERDHRLPSAVDSVLIRGMAKRPEERFGSAGELVAALELALDPLSGPAAPYARRTARRPPPASRAAPTTRSTAITRPSLAPPSRVARASRAGSVRRHRAGGPRRGARARTVALLALVVAALVVAGMAAGRLASPGSGRGASRSAGRLALTTRRAARSRAGATAATSAASPAASSTTGQPGTTVADSGLSATALEAEGHTDILNGDYTSAIATLRQALQAADHSSPTYAYALYDLGHALLLSGEAKQAIPILEQRMQIPLELPIVEQTLDQAEQAAGQPVSAAQGGPQGQGPSDGQGHHGHGQSGGAGLMAPQFAVSGLGAGA